jgi:hypothetical protein
MIESLSEQLLDEIAERVSKRLVAESMQAKQAHVADLRSQYEEFSKLHVFKPGQFVCWKPGMRNKRSPDYGEVGIVVEVLASPVYDSSGDGGNPYFREPLDILIGVQDTDGDFLIYHFDKRRFEPTEQATSEEIRPK